jgi:hypothetical protein
MVTGNVAFPAMLNGNLNLPIGADKSSAFDIKRIRYDMENFHEKPLLLLADNFGDKAEKKYLKSHEKKHEGQAPEMIYRKDVAHAARDREQENKTAQRNEKP